MPRSPGTQRRPLHNDLTAPIAATRPGTHTRAGDGTLLGDPDAELFMLAATILVVEDTPLHQCADTCDARFAETGEVGLAQHLRESMLVRSTPWPTAPR